MEEVTRKIAQLAVSDSVLKRYCSVDDMVRECVDIDLDALSNTKRKRIVGRARTVYQAVRKLMECER